MILNIPFLASDESQFDPRWAEQGYGVEASLFDRAGVMDDDIWRRVRATVRRIARDVRPRSFTFHFPVNDSDFVAEPAVLDRVFQAIDLAAEHGLDGIVLHTNRTRPIERWHAMDLAAERRRLVETVALIRARAAGAACWIGLENLPVVGNDATDADPLLVYAADMPPYVGGNVGVTLDFCHYSYSVHVAALRRAGQLAEPELYVRVLDESFEDFVPMLPYIVHHHFSAFRGLASRAGGRCVEGVLPWLGTVGEPVYAAAFRAIAASGARAVTLEIREDDYRRRRNVFRMIRWCERIIKSAGAS
ncbi:TIM barrel protein [Nonomuraea helvata]|uniref:TIM barrel protein n=1 Tax=Nonomuraea helvata TaxID=37484 RepID=A0ABV5SCA0_9ACTN